MSWSDRCVGSYFVNFARLAYLLSLIVVQHWAPTRKRKQQTSQLPQWSIRIHDLVLLMSCICRWLVRCLRAGYLRTRSYLDLQPYLSKAAIRSRGLWWRRRNLLQLHVMTDRLVKYRNVQNVSWLNRVNLNLSTLPRSPTWLMKPNKALCLGMKASTKLHSLLRARVR